MERNGRPYSCVSVKKAISERAGPRARRMGSNARWLRLAFTSISVGWVIAQIGRSAKNPLALQSSPGGGRTIGPDLNPQTQDGCGSRLKPWNSGQTKPSRACAGYSSSSMRGPETEPVENEPMKTPQSLLPDLPTLRQRLTIGLADASPGRLPVKVLKRNPPRFMST